MKKYAKVVDNTGLCQVGLGNDANSYIQKGMAELDVEQSDVDGQWYLKDKCPMKTNEEKLAENKAKFENEFFKTSLGWVRRKVAMLDGSTKDFLSDILPLLQVNVPIITYNAPDDFVAGEPTQNKNVLITDAFISECKKQVLTDFYGAQNAAV